MHGLEFSYEIVTTTRKRGREDQQYERQCHCTKWLYLRGSLKDLIGYVRLLQYGAESEASNTSSGYKNLWPPGISVVVVHGCECRVEVHHWNESRGKEGEMWKKGIRDECQSFRKEEEKKKLRKLRVNLSGLKPTTYLHSAAVELELWSLFYPFILDW